MTIVFIIGTVALTAWTFYQIGHSNGMTAGYIEAIEDGVAGEAE